MAHYQNQYGAVPQTDEYGNPICQTNEAGYGSYQTGHTTGGLGIGTTDEHGNPIRQTDETGYGSYQTDHTTGGLSTGTGITTGHHERGHQGLHRDDGSSSSSDERTGGKERINEKIKEKIWGIGHKDDRPHHTGSANTPRGPGSYGVSDKGQYRHEHGHEKKGVIEKIKEKIPGHHGH